MSKDRAKELLSERAASSNEARRRDLAVEASTLLYAAGCEFPPGKDGDRAAKLLRLAARSTFPGEQRNAAGALADLLSSKNVEILDRSPPPPERPIRPYQGFRRRTAWTRRRPEVRRETAGPTVVVETHEISHSFVQGEPQGPPQHVTVFAGTYSGRG